MAGRTEWYHDTHIECSSDRLRTPASQAEEKQQHRVDESDRASLRRSEGSVAAGRRNIDQHSRAEHVESGSE